MPTTIKQKCVMAVLYFSGINWLVRTLSPQRLYIVGYHSIGSAQTSERLQEEKYKHLTISTMMFEKQLAYMKTGGHIYVSLEDVKNGNAWNYKKPTILFFDDGFKNVVENALPVLKKYSAPGIVFLSEQLVDGHIQHALRNAEEAFSVDVAKKIYLSWDEIRAAQNELSFGSHGYSHTKLNECSGEELTKEIVSPKNRIEKETECSVIAISYPHGRHNAEVLSVVQNAGYSFGITTKEGWNSRQFVSTRPLELRKIAPKPWDELWVFKTKMYAWNVVRGISTV